MCLLIIGVIIFVWSCYLNLCRRVKYVTFNVALNLQSRKTCLASTFHTFWPLSVLMIVGFLAMEYPLDLIICISLHINPNYLKMKLNRRISNWVSRKLFYSLCIYMFFTAITPAACMLCLVTFQVCCNFYSKNVQLWLSMVLIILSNDIHFNPGPEYQNNFLNFMSWNVNSLAKKQFHRVHLIEAHNSIFKYDLISICETSLNDSVEIPEPLLNDYTFCLLITHQTLDMVG